MAFFVFFFWLLCLKMKKKEMEIGRQERDLRIKKEGIKEGIEENMEGIRKG